ncbi:Ribokinase-like protein [Collybia nuda]|uniref:Ribokinase-like protein n=1 Tax=Collybia nuda TaxID=64659 RepID=A0A9P5YHV1_9AGAR|nr:Ribokinase-like protein [Collybia nuda]
MVNENGPTFVTLGMFIIDEFIFLNDQGQPTGRTLAPQIGGGGTYAAIGARIWLPARQIGMIVDKGHDFPVLIHRELLRYGPDMWNFREQETGTTRALNSYRGDHRNFEYLTPRIRITPRDLSNSKLENCAMLHFICSPTRANAIMSEIHEVNGWAPTTIYEPIPDRCVPEELPSLTKVLPFISILSPNAEEALALLSLPLPPTRSSIERAAGMFLDIGVGTEGGGWVIIRSGGMGAYLKARNTEGLWVNAFWTNKDAGKIVDVTGAGNSFLGGLAAGLFFTSGNVEEATLYATVSASFTIEQEGLPTVIQSPDLSQEKWNDDSPQRRLELLKMRHRKQ